MQPRQLSFGCRRRNFSPGEKPVVFPLVIEGSWNQVFAWADARPATSHAGLSGPLRWDLNV
jgi:hypothetical protein